MSLSMATALKPAAGSLRSSASLALRKCRLLNPHLRECSRRGRGDEDDKEGSSKKPKGKSPNQGYWDEDYSGPEGERRFGQKMNQDFDRLMKMGDKEADPKDMDVTKRIEGEAAPTRTWLATPTRAPPKKKNQDKDGEEE